MNTTIAVFSNHLAAENAIKELKVLGVPDSNISYIYVDRTGKLVDGEMSGRVGSGAAVGVTTGAVVGALAGLAVATGIIPDIGPLVVAGPLAAALGFTGATAVAGAATGVVAGGLIGALASLGIKHDDATLYEALVKKGDILVVVRMNTFSINDVFNRAGANEIREYTSS